MDTLAGISPLGTSATPRPFLIAGADLVRLRTTALTSGAGRLLPLDAASDDVDAGDPWRRRAGRRADDYRWEAFAAPDPTDPLAGDHLFIADGRAHVSHAEAVTLASWQTWRPLGNGLWAIWLRYWHETVTWGDGRWRVERTWRPGRGHSQPELRGTGDLPDDVTTRRRDAVAFLGVAAALVGARRGRKPHRQVSMDPADWLVLMAYVKQCVDEDCTWPQVVARVATRQLDDPDFPSVTATRKKLKRWLTWYEGELRGY